MKYLGLLIVMMTLTAKLVNSSFIIPEVNITDPLFEESKQCNAASNRVGSSVISSALRQFMTRNHVKIVVNQGDVSITQTYPNADIHTGHSCSVTAQAQSVRATVSMVPGSVELSPEGVVHIDEIKNSIAVADVRHAISVSLNVRVWGGYRFFGRCKKYARKTCSTDGYAQGTNRVSVNIAASNVNVECIGGSHHLTFNLNANVIDETKDSTYPSVEVGKRSGCNLRLLGFNIGSINSRIQNYANSYVRNGNRFHELRGPRIVSELESKLGVSLGSVVTLKLNNADGSPRTCSNTPPSCST